MTALRHVFIAYSGGFHDSGYKALVGVSSRSQGLILSRLFLFFLGSGARNRGET